MMPYEPDTLLTALRSDFLSVFPRFKRQKRAEQANFPVKVNRNRLFRPAYIRKTMPGFNVPPRGIKKKLYPSGHPNVKSPASKKDLFGRDSLNNAAPKEGFKTSVSLSGPDIPLLPVPRAANHG